MSIEIKVFLCKKHCVFSFFYQNGQQLIFARIYLIFNIKNVIKNRQFLFCHTIIFALLSLWQVVSQKNRKKNPHFTKLDKLKKIIFDKLSYKAEKNHNLPSKRWLWFLHVTLFFIQKVYTLHKYSNIRFYRHTASLYFPLLIWSKE